MNDNVNVVSILCNYQTCYAVRHTFSVVLLFITAGAEIKFTARFCEGL